MKNKLMYLMTILIAALFYSIAQANGVGNSEHSMLLAAFGILGQYSTGMKIFRRNLEKKLDKEIWVKGKFGKLTSLIDHDKFKRSKTFAVKPGSPEAKNSIVHMIQDFKSDKGVIMDIPLLHPLTGQGRVGTAPLSGHAEQRKISTKQVSLNMRRHALQTRDNEMSEQLLPNKIAMELLESGGSDLKDWFARYISFDVQRSLLEGYSDNLTNSTYGIGMSKASHPNFYVQGYGQVAFKTASGTHVARTFDTGYEVNCATALATLVSGNSDLYFNTDSIKNIVYLAYQNKLQPMNLLGEELIIIFITSAQARQLRNDTAWLSAIKEAAARGSKNALFTGNLQGIPYEGAYVVIDDTIFSARIDGDTGFVDALSTTGADTGVQYGLASGSEFTFMANPRDTGARKPAIAVGAGAVLAAEGKGFKLTQEIQDHGQRIEDGGRMIYGMTRADITDDDNYFGNGAGKFYDNQTSLLYFTYSPDSITI